MLPLSQLWAMEPMAFEQFTRQAIVVREGPVADAEHSGLPLKKVGGTAVISLVGVMLKSPPLWLQRYGFVGTTAVKAAVSAAAADKSVDQIVLRIDSPGGVVDGNAELADTVYAARQVKPVIAQVDGIMASAAYYVGSQATAIYSGRMDMVGSIGVRLMLYDFSRLFANEGIEAIPIDTGKYKSAGAMGTPITDEQKADFQRIVDAYYNDFVSAIVRGRGMTDAQVRQVGDGRVFTATEALQLGLIDKIQPIEQTLAEFSQASARSRLAKARAEVFLAEL